MPESANSNNVFSALSLSEIMTTSLPPTSEPHLRDSYDAVALLSNACMLAVGFRLTGLGEDHTIPVSQSDDDSLPSLPPEWNKTENSSYAFRYSHNQSSLNYLLKVSRLGSKALIVGLTLPDEHKVHSLDVAVKDFLSPSTFPFTAPNIEDKEGTAKALRETFLSAGRIVDLASMVKLQLIQKLAPGLHKEGYEESAHAARARSPPASERRGRDESQQGDPRPPQPDLMPPYAQPRPFDDPLAAGPPRRPFPAGDFPPPGFEDEYEINRGPGAGPYGGPRRPLNIGERDLYPPGLGPHDPLRAGPGGGFAPGGGGMHPTFDDPMFGGDSGVGGELYGPGGRAPPGARYDPVGPGDGPPRGGMGRFPGGGGGMRGPFGGGGGGFGGDII